MTSDGYSTLSAGLMERGTNRVRAVLGPGASLGESKAFAQDRPADFAPRSQGQDAPAVPSHESQPAYQRPTEPIHAPEPAQLPVPPQPAAENPAPADVQPVPAPAPTVAAPAPAPAPKPAPRKKSAPEKQPAAPVQASRRACSGTSLMIHQPPSGDMSEVTISVTGKVADEAPSDTPSKFGQRPTSVTYERRTAEEQEQYETAVANGEEEQALWIDTPSFSGPDRRSKNVSPEIERRRSVPPRLKVSVRLEQERYLRLKLASQDTQRTQQDIITSAIDEYLDTVGVDRFVRVAMGFGGAKPTSDSSGAD